MVHSASSASTVYAVSSILRPAFVAVLFCGQFLDCWQTGHRAQSTVLSCDKPSRLTARWASGRPDADWTINPSGSRLGSLDGLITTDYCGCVDRRTGRRCRRGAWLITGRRDGRNRLNTWPVCPAFSWRLVSSTFMAYVYILIMKGTYFSNTISNAMKHKVTNIKWSLFTIQWPHKEKI